MSIILWVLVDNSGRLFYTGDTKDIVENYKLSFENDHDYKNLKVIQLKGEIND